MALRLAAKYRRILNPNAYHANYASASASAVSDSSQNELVDPPPSSRNLSISGFSRRTAAERVYESQVSGSGGGERACSEEGTGNALDTEEKGNEADDYGAGKEKVKEDGMSVSKRMLAKMRAEWKMFSDGQRAKMFEDKERKRERTWALREVEEKKEGGSWIVEVMEKRSASCRKVANLEEELVEVREAEKMQKSDRSVVEFKKMDEMNRNVMGIAEKNESDKKDKMLLELRKMEENEFRAGRRVEELRGMEEKGSGCWSSELGELVEKETEFPFSKFENIFSESRDALQEMKDESNAICNVSAGDNQDGAGKGLRSLVSKLLTFDEEKVKEDATQLKKRMLVKMRAEQKTFRGGLSSVQSTKMLEDKDKRSDWIAELQEVEEKEKGDVGTVVGSNTKSEDVLEEEDRHFTEELGKVMSDRSVVELGEMNEKNWREIGIAERNGNNKKYKILLELRKMEENVIRARKRIEELMGMEMEGSRYGTSEWGEFVEEYCELPSSNCGNILTAQDEKNDKLRESWDVPQEMKGERSATCSVIAGNPDPASGNLKDTLKMLKTVKKKLVGQKAKVNVALYKLMNSKDKGKKVKQSSRKVVEKKLTISIEELQDSLKKLQNDVDEERK